MKFGVRECCDVVLRAKSAQKVGKKIFYRNEPVCYFDTLKTSTFEGAATTVYAQGGRGNARLMSWDGERTVTFTMEDALISPIGLSILSGAGLIEAEKSKPVIQHLTETVQRDAEDEKFYVKYKPYFYEHTDKSREASIYVMILDQNGEICSEPYFATGATKETTAKGFEIIVPATSNKVAGIPANYNVTDNPKPETNKISEADVILVDYYTAHETGAFEINITPDKFGGTFYLEASTLWRDQVTGKDLPAEFIIPKCKVQSNFSFTLSSSGDPSTFTFTMDAFPDYTRWNREEKVLATIQIIGAGIEGIEDPDREQTWTKYIVKDNGKFEIGEEVPVPTLNDSTPWDYDASGLDLTLATPSEGTITDLYDSLIVEVYEQTTADNNEVSYKVITTLYPDVSNVQIYNNDQLPGYSYNSSKEYAIRIKGVKDNRESNWTDYISLSNG